MPDSIKIPFSKWANFTEKQKIAERALDEYDYVLYGGAVGGGKSYWLRKILVKFLGNLYKKHGLKNVVGGLFCEDYPALKDRHLAKISSEFPEWMGERHADHKDYGNCYILNESMGRNVIAFRNLDDPSKYQSSEFAIVGVDELTKNKKETFDFLRMRKRWKNVERTKFVAGTNPGGIGHGWVKKYWMDKEFDLNEQEQDQFLYIPATAYDNPYLPESYYKQLEGLPPEWRKAYIEGDWDIFKGQFFTMWRREKHVRPVHRIPETFRKFIGIDYGSTAPFAAYWIAVDWDGNYWVYKEYYAAGLTAEDNAKAVVVMTAPDEHIEMVVADRAIFAKQGYGETIADILRKNGIGQPATNIPFLEPSMGGRETRVARAQLLMQKLQWSETKQPNIFFFETCVNAIKTIPELIHDELNPEDVDTDGPDHSYDSITYVLQKIENIKVEKPPFGHIEKKIAEIKKEIETNNFNSVFNESI